MLGSEGSRGGAEARREARFAELSVGSCQWAVGSGQWAVGRRSSGGRGIGYQPEAQDVGIPSSRSDGMKVAGSFKTRIGFRQEGIGVAERQHAPERVGGNVGILPLRGGHGWGGIPFRGLKPTATFGHRSAMGNRGAAVAWPSRP
jgi:hypothetical protein